MGIFAKSSQGQVRQFIAHDDHSLAIRNLPVDEGFVVEKKDGKTVAAWLHFHEQDIECTGYKGVPPGEIVLSCARDILWDPYDRVPDSENPTTGKPIDAGFRTMQDYSRKVAQSQQDRIDIKGGTTTIMDKIVWMLGALDAVMLIGLIVIKYIMVKG